jgi:hypothetical protein
MLYTDQHISGSHTLVNEKKVVTMFDFDLPKIRHSLGQAALQDPYPAWFVDTRGVIYAANLMAFWLWDTLRPGEPMRPDALLGNSIFNVLADNIGRIPVDENVEFFTKRSAIVKRLYARSKSPLYTSFIAAMKANPRLTQIYESATLTADRKWEYPLRILHPGQRTSPALLELQVTNFCLEGDNGALAVYVPTSATSPVIEAQYSLLVTSHSGDRVYHLPKQMERIKMENDQLLTNLQNYACSYYPTLIQDTLWYIIEENRAHQLLVGGSVKNTHFFELFFAPQLKEWLGPIQETSAPRAIRYFDKFTGEFQREDHELHGQYEQVMRRLLQLQDFRDVLDVSRKLTIYLNMPTSYDETFYTCRVLLPYPFSPSIALQFRSMVKCIYPQVYVHADTRHYQLTLVPENNETDAALILLHLASTASELTASGNTAQKQFLWGLTVTKTIEEGLTGKNGEDTQWEPEAAFRRIGREVNMKLGSLPVNATEEIITELRVIVEVLDRKRVVEKGALLFALERLASRSNCLEHLSKFLAKELEIHKRVGD